MIPRMDKATCKFRLINHRSHDVLRLPDALIKGTTVKLLSRGDCFGGSPILERRPAICFGGITSCCLVRGHSD